MESVNKHIERFEYMPYDLDIAKKVWFNIASGIIIKKGSRKKLSPGKMQAALWTNLIKYVHGDKGSAYDINKSICLMGKTGSGKTKTMQIMSKYISIDDVKYKCNGTKLTFNYNIVTSKSLVILFQKEGFEAIEKYMNVTNLCIDDLGAEITQANHYGNKADVMSEIIESRDNKNLLTHYTTNFNEDLILDKYNSRVHSRILGKSNMIKLNDKDYRIE